MRSRTGLKAVPKIKVPALPGNERRSSRAWSITILTELPRLHNVNLLQIKITVAKLIHTVDTVIIHKLFPAVLLNVWSIRSP
jgi:hypothetical protein